MNIVKTSSWLSFNPSDAEPSSWGKVDLSRIQAVKKQGIAWGIRSALNRPTSCWTSEDKGGSTKASASLLNLPTRTSSFTIPWCLNKQHLILQRWTPCVLMTLPHMYRSQNLPMARFFKSCRLCCSNVLLPNKRCAESKAESLSANWALVPLNPQIGVEMHAADALCTTWPYQRLKTWRSVVVEANWNHLLDSEISPVSAYFRGKTCNQSNFHEEPSIWVPALYKASWVGSYPLGGIFAEAQGVNIRSPAELK